MLGDIQALSDIQYSALNFAGGLALGLGSAVLGLAATGEVYSVAKCTSRPGIVMGCCEQLISQGALFLVNSTAAKCGVVASSIFFQTYSGLITRYPSPPPIELQKRVGSSFLPKSLALGTAAVIGLINYVPMRVTAFVGGAVSYASCYYLSKDNDVSSTKKKAMKKTL